MRILKSTPILLPFVLLAMTMLPVGGTLTAHRHATHHVGDPKTPPPPPDSTKSALAKLVVKNLGPLINSDKNDFAPTLTADGLTMYYVSERPNAANNGDDHFWKTTRTDISNDTTGWSAPEDVIKINSNKSDGAASIAADGQTIYFATNRSNGDKNNMDIWQATLDGTEWRDVHEVGPPVNTTAWESQPSISPDGKKLYFASNRENKKNIDIFVSHKLPDGRWAEPVNLGSKINTEGYDGSPFIAADGQTLFFCSGGRPGGFGGLDIYQSEWKGPSDTDWTAPQLLPEPINSSGNDFFISLPAASNSLYFASDRKGGNGQFDIYVALNPPAPKPTLVLKGRCFDMNTQENLAAHVVIVDERTNDTVYNKLANSATGEYLALLPADKDGKLGGPYVISATEPNHFPYPATRDMIPLRDDTSRVWVHDIPMTNEKPPIVHWVTETPQLVKDKPSLYPNFKGVIIREQSTIDLFTLLPMVFFDMGNGALPNRYVMFSSPEQTNGFTEDTLTSTMNAYYNYLNIMGLRLRQNPTANITLTGTNSQDVDQEMSIDLSRQRAEAVKKYLVEIWGIPPERIKVEARKLPETPTLPTTPEGIAENRRVEFGSDAWEIVHPVLHKEVVKRPDAPTGGFAWENGLRDEFIAKRDLMVSYHGQPWAEISDLGSLSTTTYSGFNWRSAAGNKLPDGEDKMSVQLKVTDKKGREVMSNTDDIDVKQFSLSQVMAKHTGDKTQETYNLILFTYNKADMGKWNHKILDSYVYQRIQPTSDVSVNGFTDILGTDDYNEKLSTNRANAVKNDISGHIKGRVASLTAHGYGKIGISTEGAPPAPLYTNSLPEGRYYNRTVQVIVETPISSTPQ